MKIKLFALSLIPFLASANTNIMKNDEIANLQNQESLKHLFDNSKFPVDDYIYKAGKKEPNKNQPTIAEEIEKIEELDKKIITEKPNIQIQETINEKNIQREALQNKIKNQTNTLNKQMIQDEQNLQEKRLKKLIKESILANRDNSIKTQTQNPKYGVDGFTNQKSIDVSTNEHKLLRMIRAGRMIPAILTTAISSDLSGIVTAQIEEDIYAAMGRAVLIPRGSKAIGSYQNNNTIGQDRLEITWREIITPQGVNILLTNAKASDNMGMSGAIGALNNKYWDRYALPYGLSTLSNGLLLSIASKIGSGQNNNNSEYTSEIYSNFQGDIKTIVSELMQQQREIKPTIEIRSGSRIFIVPSYHMWFAPPKNGEVLMRYFQ